MSRKKIALVEVEPTVGGRWAIRELVDHSWRSIATCYEKEDADRIAAALRSQPRVSREEDELVTRARQWISHERYLAYHRDNHSGGNQFGADLMTELLSLVESQPGYVSVPMEPTRAMLSALCGEPLLLAASQEQAARVAYDAMIAASEGVQK